MSTLRDSQLVEAAMREADERENDRLEEATGEAIGVEIQPLADLERLDVASGVDSIDRHAVQPPRSHQRGMPSRPYVKPWSERHPDSRA